jgi:hypothetical protein
MRATLSFSLPEEAVEHRTAIHAGDYYCIISDMNAWFRSERKYSKRSEAELAVIEDVRARFWEIIEEHEMARDFT